MLVNNSFFDVFAVSYDRNTFGHETKLIEYSLLNRTLPLLINLLKEPMGWNLVGKSDIHRTAQEYSLS
jgi:hypothetical protein